MMAWSQLHQLQRTTTTCSKCQVRTSRSKFVPTVPFARTSQTVIAINKITAAVSALWLYGRNIPFYVASSARLPCGYYNAVSHQNNTSAAGATREGKNIMVHTVQNSEHFLALEAELLSLCYCHGRTRAGIGYLTCVKSEWLVVELKLFWFFVLK